VIMQLLGHCQTTVTLVVFNHPNSLYLQRMGEGAVLFTKRQWSVLNRDQLPVIS